MAYLFKRVSNPGITAVVGRGQQGKTALLRELGRELFAKRNFQVGYHENKGNDNSMLHAISSLYDNWYHQSGKIKQLELLKEKFRSNPITNAGKMIFKSMGLDSIREVFEDIEFTLTGAEIAPKLEYDEALKFVSVIEQLNASGVVLILDAWEQSISLDIDHKILEAFVKNLSEWGNVHIILGVREPYKDGKTLKEDCFERTKDLAKLHGHKIHHLAEMDMSNELTRNNLIGFIHNKVRASEKFEDDFIIAQLQGWPGALDRVVKEDVSIKNKNDFKRAIADAQALRWPEILPKFQSLNQDERTLVIRLALLQRLYKASWDVLSKVILEDETFA